MAADDPLIGKTLGDYTIQSLLGRGGMSRVYKGYDANLDRYAAVKVISGDFATTTEEEYTRRFQTEARAIAHLRHENIVGVYQFGRTEGTYYMAQVFLEGKDLRALLKSYADRRQRIPKDEILRIVNDITRALDYAHEQGVIHRDIKPSNIMLEKGTGRAILMDFGLALAVHEGTAGDTFGSAHYIAPEQAVSSAKAVPQSDLYSLGIVVYEMVAGKVPFDDPSVMSVALKHLNEMPPPPTMYNPDMSTEVEKVILRALDKDPERRYASGKEFFRALDYAFETDNMLNVGPQIPVTDLLESQPGPPEELIPVPAELTPPPSADEDTDARGGLAGRFRRRQQEKEAIAAAEAGQGLQIDDDTLNKLLDAYADPADLGLVGKNAVGLPPESFVKRPSSVQSSTQDAPPEKKKRRSRTGLLLTLLLVVAVVAAGVWFGMQGGEDGNYSGTGTPDAVAAVDLTATAQAMIIDATAAATGTPAPSVTPDAPVNSPAPRDTVTPRATSAGAGIVDAPDTTPGEPTAINRATATRVLSLTPELTATNTITPEPTLTVEPSATPQPTTPPPTLTAGVDDDDETPTAQVANSPVPTDTPTAEPTPTSTITVTPAPITPPFATPAPNIRLRYEEEAAGQGWLLLINLTGRTLDVSKLVFEHQRRDGVILRYEAALWNRDGITANPAQMPARSCFQLVTTDGTAGNDGGPDCARFLGFYRTYNASRYFWLSGEGGATFTVRYADNDMVLAECVIDADVCDFYAGPDANTFIPPTPIAPDEGLTITLRYDDNEFLLINTSGQTVDISNLVFEQVSGAGSRRFDAIRWDQLRALDPPTAMRNNGCYQLVHVDAPQNVPLPETCTTLVGWYRTSIPSRYFWRADVEGMTFNVYLGDSIVPLATCAIDAGECEVILPPQLAE